MIKGKDILSLLAPTLPAAVFISAIGFVENKQLDKTCQEIVIDIDSQYDNYFVGREEIMFQITQGGSRNLLGSWWREINLKDIEKELLTHKFIRKADVYKDLEGRLLVDVYQQTPIARITPVDGPHVYVSAEGEILPVSEHFTSRVTMVGGEMAGQLVQTHLPDSPYGAKVFDLLKFINKDPFWKAQIAGLEIDRSGDILVHPQVTKQVVLFGQAEDIEEKFEKLKIFYGQILPHKGWNHYTTVNLKYHSQIVCE